jgi:hypothetical protein
MEPLFSAVIKLQTEGLRGCNFCVIHPGGARRDLASVNLQAIWNEVHGRDISVLRTLPNIPS